MGSHAKNNNSQQNTAAAGPTGAGTNTPTPLGVAGPMTTAKMTPQLQKNPVSTAAPGRGYIPGVSDAGPKLPGMAAGFDSHGMPIAQPARPSLSLATPRDRLAFMLSRGPGGASHGDRGGYTTSGRDSWGGSSGGRSGGYW